MKVAVPVAAVTCLRLRWKRRAYWVLSLMETLALAGTPPVKPLVTLRISILPYFLANIENTVPHYPPPLPLVKLTPPSGQRVGPRESRTTQATGDVSFALWLTMPGFGLA